MEVTFGQPATSTDGSWGTVAGVRVVFRDNSQRVTGVIVTGLLSDDSVDVVVPIGLIDEGASGLAIGTRGAALADLSQPPAGTAELNRIRRAHRDRISRESTRKRKATRAGSRTPEALRPSHVVITADGKVVGRISGVQLLESGELDRIVLRRRGDRDRRTTIPVRTIETYTDQQITLNIESAPLGLFPKTDGGRGHPQFSSIATVPRPN